MSGNTTYIYKITPYTVGDISYSDISNVLTYTSNVQEARDLSAVFVDSSAIKIQFTAPKNSYNSTYYYELDASSDTTITNISGYTYPLLINGLMYDTSYTCYILTYLDGLNNSRSSVLNIRTKQIYSITGTYSYSSNTSYKTILSFTNTTTAATIKFIKTIDVSLIVVAGGGGGGANTNISGYGEGGGGGGGGGVIAGDMRFISGNTYTLNIGTGGLNSVPNSMNQTNGGDSSINDNNFTIIKAIGGGFGGCEYSRPNNCAGKSGGSSGGTSGNATSGTYIYSQSISSSYIIPINSNLQNYGNVGGGAKQSQGGGGGGGAGSAGITVTDGNGGNGGNGYTWNVTNKLYSCGGGGGCNGYNATKLLGGNTYTGGGNGGQWGVDGSGSNATYYGCGGGGGASKNTGSVSGRGYQGIIIIAFN